MRLLRSVKTQFCHKKAQLFPVVPSIAERVATTGHVVASDIDLAYIANLLRIKILTSSKKSSCPASAVTARLELTTRLVTAIKILVLSSMPLGFGCRSEMTLDMSSKGTSLAYAMSKIDILAPLAPTSSFHAYRSRLSLFLLQGSISLECPATFVPVEMRQTGTGGAVYGTREEAYGGADRESAATG
jgi:hypothetical protein